MTGAISGTVLLSGIVGSTAYGLAGPDSDIDRLGVFAAPTVAFHGLHPPIGKAASVVRSNPDATYHEAARLATLCLSGNPTVTELLYLDAYEVATAPGLELVAVRSAFHSAKRTRDAYVGYATAQCHRLLNAGQPPFQPQVRSRVGKHGRHLLRLLDQGLELFTTGHLTIRVVHTQRYVDFGDLVAENPDVARQALADAQAGFDSERSALPERPDEEVVERWLLRVRDAH